MKMGVFQSLTIPLMLALVGCPTPEPEVPLAEGVFGAMGQPMPVATATQRETFMRGEAVAQRRFLPRDGLGPRYNVSFCGACHERPVFGGASSRYRNFQLVSQTLSDGSEIKLGNGGVLPQFELVSQQTVALTACNAADPNGQMGVAPGMGPNVAVGRRRPTEATANLLTGRNAVPFFGVGLLAEIPEEEILANADPRDADGDGISGRANLDRGFVGRFGVKAQTVSIEGFIRGPLFNHLGITSNPLPEDFRERLPVASPRFSRTASALGGSVGRVTAAQAAAPEEPILDDDQVCDPELSDSDLFDLVSWAMLLAAPAPDAPTASSTAGEQVFSEIGCASCHTPSLRSPRGRIPAFTDLLLHDMGPALADGIVMGRAGQLTSVDEEGCSESGRGCEFRTQPLWGLAATGPYLHDGRADTLEESILAHGGEGQRSRDRYDGLSQEKKTQLRDFLLSLGGASQHSEGLLPQGDSLPEQGDFGAPRAGMTDVQEIQFQRGRHIFDRDFSVADGVGENFNGDACRSCHFEPVLGGAGPVDLDVTRQGIVTSGMFQQPAGGTMVHRHSVRGTARPPSDANANIRETRQTPPLFGLGLIEQIAEADIVAAAMNQPAGVTGRVHRLRDGRLGRLGWKADVPSVAEFARDATSNELGLTVAAVSGQSFGNLTDSDTHADPEVAATVLEDMAFFIANLAPPPREQLADTSGRQTFERIGCLSCHRNYTTSTGAAVELFSDLLLHDVQASDYVGVASGDADVREFRTTPLWGLRASGPYWHDGRAATIEASIALHETESAASRMQYEQLSAADREALLRFLRSL